MARQVTRIDSNRVAAANTNILTCIKQRGVSLVYDRVLDTLFVEIGGPRKATNVPVDEYVMLRVDPVTLEVVGGEIPVYRSDFVRHRGQLAKSLEELGILLNRDFPPMAPAKARKVGQLLQEWIEEFGRS